MASPVKRMKLDYECLNTDYRSRTSESDLNNDCLANIFMKLSVYDIYQCQAVSPRWYRIAQEVYPTVSEVNVDDFIINDREFNIIKFEKIIKKCGRSVTRVIFTKPFPINMEPLRRHPPGGPGYAAVGILKGYCPRLTSLDLSGYTIVECDLHPLRQGFGFLTSITLSAHVRFFEIKDHSLRVIFKHLQKLRHVSLYNFAYLRGRFLLGLSDTITSLRLDGFFELRPYLIIQTLQRLINITELSLNCCFLTSPAVLAVGQHLPKLTNFSFTYQNIIIAATAQNVLDRTISSLVNLRTLTLIENMNVTDSTLQLITVVCHLLTKLDISECGEYEDEYAISSPLTVEGLMTISNLPMLTDLTVNGMKLVTATLVNVWMTRGLLTRFNASGCINLADLRGIFDLCLNLKFINLKQCPQITNVTVSNAVYELRQQSNLQRSIQMNVSQTGVDIKEIKERGLTHPNLQLIYEDPRVNAVMDVIEIIEEEDL